MFHKKKAIIFIDGMGCKHCAKKVQETLLSIENIKKGKVNLKKKTATITINGMIDKTKIKEKIESLDYIVNEIEEVER